MQNEDIKLLIVGQELVTEVVQFLEDNLDGYLYYEYDYDECDNEVKWGPYLRNEKLTQDLLVYLENE